ncbi:Uncharacterized protein DBV15_10757 [Temnothorax longispinosus]|uniref:Uncharacterized protein n=1 Tax=Temnothorax longispinosus TaxID=300112 RepID=A0A4S2L5J1_9HYME|nr:Uncharacterized protein DBV15_10757 [Temnothorax longispinosus]
MNRNYGLYGTRSWCRTVFRQPVGSVRRSVAFVGPAISCQDGRARRTALLVSRPRWGVLLYQRRAASLEIVRSTKRARRVPAGRASERQERSDLICDRETSRLLTIAPVPSTANLHHLRIHLFPHPPSLPRPLPLLRCAPFLSVPPLRRLPCLPLLFTSLIAR